MKLNNQNIIDIAKVLNDAGCYTKNSIQIKTYINQIETGDAQIFKSYSQFMAAMRKLKGYEFDYALNRAIGIKKDNYGDIYFIVSKYNFEYSKEIIVRA